MSEAFKPETRIDTVANIVELKEKVLEKFSRCLDLYELSSDSIYLNQEPSNTISFFSSIKALYVIMRGKIKYVKPSKQGFYEALHNLDDYFINPFMKPDLQEISKISCSSFLLLADLLEELGYLKVEMESVELTPKLVQINIIKQKVSGIA